MLSRNALILAYHRINSTGKDPLAVPVENFREQMDYFYRAGYTSLTLQEYVKYLLQNSAPKKTLVVTFDDGYRDNFLFAFPILRAYGFRATVFLIADFIGTDNLFPMDREKNWNKILDEDLPLTWEQVLQMKEYGIEFGSHSCTHPNLDDLAETEVLAEIRLSKRRLEEKLRSAVTSFCYPSGRLNPAIKEAVRAEGYVAAVVTPRNGQIAEDLYSLKRVGIYPGDTGWRFRLKISYPFALLRDLGLLYRLKTAAGGASVQCR